MKIKYILNNIHFVLMIYLVIFFSGNALSIKLISYKISSKNILINTAYYHNLK